MKKIIFVSCAALVGAMNGMQQSRVNTTLKFHGYGQQSSTSTTKGSRKLRMLNEQLTSLQEHAQQKGLSEAAQAHLKQAMAEQESRIHRIAGHSASKKSGVKDTRKVYTAQLTYAFSSKK